MLHVTKTVAELFSAIELFTHHVPYSLRHYYKRTQADIPI